jgi:type IV pilus assembly protein PilV
MFVYNNQISKKTISYKREVHVKRLNCQKGFSLIELLIAMFLLMVGFLGVFTVMWTSAHAGNFSRQMTTAANLNEDIMEQLTALSCTASDLNDTAGVFKDLNNTNFPLLAVTNLSAAGFNRQIKVQNDVPSASNKTISVKISWNEGATVKTRTFEMLKRQNY